MGFLHPELALFALPALWFVWRARSAGVGTTLVRSLLVLTLVAALTAPYLRLGEQGRDLIVVVDRSRSMSPEARASAEELVRLAEDEREDGDRIGIVSFGANAAIERLPSADARFSGLAREVDPDASDLAGALEAALGTLAQDRPGSILVISDGEAQGRDPRDVARRALARGVTIDVRATPRPGGADLAVEALDLPDQVALGEPFQFSAWVWSDERLESDYELRRDGQVLARGRRVFEPGINRLLFRDRLERTGLIEYRLEVLGAGDRTVENNRGLAALRVVGERPILVLDDDGGDSALAQALRSGGHGLRVARPEDVRLDRLGLASYRAVVLENVAAARLGSNGMRALADFVLERGGGLCVTGGKASFGLGGYHRSVLDPLLPVSLEMRQERRKQGVALVAVLDRSGSMAVEVQPGVEKMQLANLGTAAAIELLSPMDSVGVIAVDSASHVIQPLTPAANTAEIVSRVKRIRSEGGGIFVRTGLLAAGRMLEEATQVNRHVVLFADANDSEEQEDCESIAQRFTEMATTLSVIALGTEADADSDFLKRLATRGGGAVYFVQDPQDLPRVFAQDTLTFARSTWIEEPTPTRALADLFGLGELSRDLQQGSFPALDGYNLTYLRTEASVGVITDDEHRSPVLAFVQRGLGRVAAYTGQVGGSFGAPLVQWSGFQGFFATLGRWLVGQEEPDDYFPSVRREGREAVVAVEVAEGARDDAAQMTARLTDPDGRVRELVLERVAEGRFEARTLLSREGVALGTLHLGGERFVSLPPLALPYSPEFERRDESQSGERALAELARITGGRVAPAASELLRGERDARVWRTVVRELLFAALLLWLLEIAARRLEWWGALAKLRWPFRSEPAARARQAPAADAGARAAAGPNEIEPVLAEAAPPTAAPTMPSATLEGSLEQALARARRAAERRTER